MAEDTSNRPADDGHGTDIRTFLFADLRGWTRFTQEHGDEAASVLASWFAELVRDEVPVFEGELLELRGDEALCVFRSARQALRAAVELQRRLRTPDADGEVFPVGVGIGLDAGEAVPTEGGYRGGALNLAARLCAIAKPGQILASESATHLARRVDGLRFVPRGVVRVKGIADPVRLVEVLAEVALPPVPAAHRGSRRRRTSGRAVGAVVAGLVVAGAVVAALVAARGGSGRPLVVSHDALVLVGSNGHARSVGDVGAAPSAVTVGGGWIWVANRDDGTVTALRLDGSRSETIHVGTAPSGIAYDDGILWVADSGSGRVDRINTTGGIANPIPIPTGNGPQGVAVSAGRVWVSNSLDGTVSEVNPDQDKVVKQIPAEPDPTAIVAAHGTLWVANTTSDTVTRIDARTGKPLPPVRVQDGPDALAVSGGGVWVANGDSATVTRISASDASPGQTIPAGLAPQAIAVSGGTVWVSDARGKLAGLHPSAPDQRTRAALTGVPLALAGTPDRLWVTVGPPLTGHRGGTLRALSQFSPPDPLDPAISFNPPGGQVLTMTNDGLLSFRRVSGPQGETLVADLATAIPQPTDNGRTYTFEVRRGVRYSTGQPVRARDFRWALERVFDAGVGGDPYYTNIVGAAACLPRPPPAGCDLGQGIHTDDAAGTVTFHLTRADPDFPFKLALPFADALPRSVPAPPDCHAPGCGYTRQPPPLPATGPYMISPTRLGFNTAGRLVLVRNPHFHQWSAQAQPSGYPDRIVYRYGQTSTREASEIEHGKADWSADGAPPKTLARLIATIPNQVHQTTALDVFGLTLNSDVPPFTSPLARQAVNYAINRSALIRLGFGAFPPTCQTLPPGMLGYIPYCPYTERVAVSTPQASWLGPDVERARRLVNESGTKGTPVTFWLNATGINAPAAPRSKAIQVGRKVVSALRSIGYPSQLHVVGSQSYAPVTAQMTQMWWFDDYPTPSDFLQLLFSCEHTPTPSIPTRLCDRGLDRQMSHAAGLQMADATAAAAAWTHADHALTDRAPWVPLYTPTSIDILSKRVGNYHYNPQSWILLDQLWVR